MSELNDIDEKVSVSEKHSSPPDYSQPFSDEVIFEDYLHYAAIQRQAEEEAVRGSPEGQANPQSKKSWADSFIDRSVSWFSDHKGPNVNVDVGHAVAHARHRRELTVNEEERVNAARALRIASWASVFYLITTDILGPFNAPFAISQVGWVPGIILYFFMGLIAAYTGLILWRLYIRLDSVTHPLRTYADIAERIYGRTARHVCTILQAVQLIVNVGTICLGNGQALAQMTKGKLCFSICILIWMIVGMVIGQVRTLKSYGWLANSAVWLNLLVIFLSMGFVAHSPPNFAAAMSSLGVSPGPVKTELFATDLPLFSKVNGIMQMVFAYGGAMIFPEMMAEMRRPMDFWKGMAMAQMLIFSAYLMYGIFVYSFQGQFTLPLAFQGVSKFSWQTVGNALSLVSGIIAAGLYGNIGIKVIYINIVEDMFHGPTLMSKKGHIIWFFLVIGYWALAFIIGSAIPQIQTITSLIAAVAIMQFTYSFPPLLRLGYDVLTDAMAEDEKYIPGMGTRVRKDTWNDWSRWKRGLFSGRWYFKLLNFIIGFGGLAMACLGMWGAGESIKAAFLTGAATSFGCTAPV
ncbi:hypothetical protein BDN72DRAFT_778575 [Pluteus cervinus]|uniref:Uncharacterized protein n=1 Tax=Pluteus cervinus TaxID=181527 RepID=A0ACD3A6D7_9AGAR|nr:hypothetical protein BDN72DRAFT_778575 [Pluteus cervinus]